MAKPSLVTKSNSINNVPYGPGEPIHLAKMNTGRGIYFDGVTDRIVPNYLNAAHTIEYNSDDKNYLTMSVWLKPDIDQSLSPYVIEGGSRIYGGVNESVGVFVLGTGEGADHGKVRVFLNDDVDDGSPLQSTTSITDGNWHHIVITHDATLYKDNAKLYIDGNLESTQDSTDPYTGFTFGANRKLVLGGVINSDGMMQGAWGTNYAGGMSDFQLWSNAWLADDVKYAYKNPENTILDRPECTLNSDSLRLWYPMSDGGSFDGQSCVQDASPKGRSMSSIITPENAIQYVDDLITNGTFDGTFQTVDYDEAQPQVLINGWKVQTAGTNGVNHYVRQYGSTQAVEIYSALTHGNYTSLISSSFALRKHQIYKITFRVKDLGGTGYLYFKTSQSSGITVSAVIGGIEEQVEGLSSDWQTITRYVVPYEKDDEAYLVFGNRGTAALPTDKKVHVAIDDVSIIEINSQYNGFCEFYGDELFTNSDQRHFDNTANALRSGGVINSGAANHYSYYEIKTQGLGSELLDETSSFTSGAWDDSAGTTTITGGNMVFTRTADGDGSHTTANLTEANAFTVEANTTYFVSITCSAYSAGRMIPKIGEASDNYVVTSNGTVHGNTWIYGTGTYNFSITTASDTTEFKLYMHSSEGFVGTITNVSVKKGINFEHFGSPDNYPGTVFCLNHGGGQLPYLSAANSVYNMSIGEPHTDSSGNGGGVFGWKPAGANKVFLGSDNIISDHDFESGFGAWADTTTSGATVAIETTEVYSGSKSVKMISKGANTAYISRNLIGKPLIKRQIYSLDMYIKSDGTNAPKIRIWDNHNSTAVHDLTDTDINEISTGYTSSSWGHYRIYFQAPNESANQNVSFKITAPDASDSVCYIDKVSVKWAKGITVNYNSNGSLGSADGAHMYLRSNNQYLSANPVLNRMYRLTLDPRIVGDYNTYDANVQVFNDATISETIIRDFFTWKGYHGHSGSAKHNSLLEFKCTSTTGNYARIGQGMSSGESLHLYEMSLKEIGTAKGWTDMDNQDTIAQTALMNGAVKVNSSHQASNSPYYTIQNTCPLTGLSNFSINVWSKKDQYVDHHTFIAHTNVGNYFRYTPVSVGDYGDQVGIFLELSDGDVTAAKTGIYDDGMWHMWTATYDGATVKLYQDSNLKASQAGTGVLTNGFNRLLAYGGVTPADYGSGIVDEISKWNKALSQNEIVELFENGMPVDARHASTSSSLVGYWRNNNSEIWDDLSTNNNKATSAGKNYQTSFIRSSLESGKCSNGFFNNIKHAGGGSVYIHQTGNEGFEGGSGSQITIGSGPTIDNLWDGGGTIEFWVKAMNVQGSATIVQKKGGSSTGWYIRLTDVSTAGLCFVEFLQEAGTTDGRWATQSRHINPKTWHHVAITFNALLSTDPIIYIDGSSKTLTEHTGMVGLRMSDVDRTMMIGRQVNEKLFDGYLDEFKVYRSALSASEIMKNYKHEKNKHSN